MRKILAVLCSFVLSELCSASPFQSLLTARSPEVKSNRCTYSRNRRMLSVDCYAMGLTQIPSLLRSDIEVLDLTHNRIREILNTSFVNYSSLRYLFLSDNSISFIESGAFEPISDLESLDLTLNSFHFMPDALSSLPVLTKLMMGSNPFVEVVFTKMLPSIKYLSLSNCKLKRFPDFTALPGLLQVNMSSNQIQSIGIHQVAPMCRLELLDLRGNPRLFKKEHCNCQLLVKWTKRRSSDFKLFPDFDSICKNTTEGRETVSDPEICFNNDTQLILEESELIASACESEVMKYGSGPLRLNASVAWTLAIAGICLVILVCFFSLYCIRKKQMARESARSSERLTGKAGRT